MKLGARLGLAVGCVWGLLGGAATAAVNEDFATIYLAFDGVAGCAPDCNNDGVNDLAKLLCFEGVLSSGDHPEVELSYASNIAQARRDAGNVLAAIVPNVDKLLAAWVCMGDYAFVEQVLADSSCLGCNHNVMRVEYNEGTVAEAVATLAPCLGGTGEGEGEGEGAAAGEGEGEGAAEGEGEGESEPGVCSSYSLDWQFNAANGHWYRRTLGTYSWGRARQIAQTWSGYLAVPATAEENDWLTQESCLLADVVRAWTGLNDLLEEGTFAWENGEPLVYTNWFPGNPSNSEGNEDCGEVMGGLAGQVSSTVGAWNDWHSTDTSYAVIERETAPGAADPRCDGDGSEWTYSNVLGHWYRVTPPLHWGEAADLAISWCGYLVTINNSFENDWLVGQSGLLSGVDQAWTGLNDAAVEGTFAWLNGETSSYRNWYATEPNNLGNEDFGTIWGTADAKAGQWNDNSDNEVHVGLVERDTNPNTGSMSVGQSAAYFTQNFAALDADRNGLLDFTEVSTQAKETLTPAQLLFGALDANRDALLSAPELRALAGTASALHPADSNGNGKIDLGELVRAVQLYHVPFGCGPNPGSTEDGYAVGSRVYDCARYAPGDPDAGWQLTLEEVMRVIQLYNAGGYYACGETEDGFCAAGK